MNREQAREAAAVMLAWADGKEVVCKARFKISDWDSLLTNPVWNWSDFIYKVKDEAKLRPWTADEVPLGAWMREIEDTSQRWLITNNQTTDHRHMWLITKEHSTDGGKTWLPCGVVEEAK